MSKHKITALLTLVLGAFVLLSVPPTALAANQTVNNCDNDTELRSDLTAMQSSGGGVLSFSCGVKTIVLAGGLLPTITTYTAVEGGNKITLSGNNASQIFYVAGGGSLNLYNITLTKGSSGGDGGAIYNLGTLTVNSSKFWKTRLVPAAGQLSRMDLSMWSRVNLPETKEPTVARSIRALRMR